MTLGDLLQHGNNVPDVMGKRESEVHRGDIKYQVNLNKSHLTSHRRVTTFVNSAVREFLAALCVLIFFFFAKSPWDYFYFFQSSKMKFLLIFWKLESILVLM